METAMCMYDIPTDAGGYYGRFRSFIAPFAVRVNLSVYIIPLSFAEKVRAKVRELEAEFGVRTDTRILRFDPSEEKQVREMVRWALIEDVRRTAGMAREAAQKHADRLDLQGEALSRAKRELDRIATAAVIFALREDLDQALKVARRLVAWEAEQFRRRQKRLDENEARKLELDLEEM